MSSTNKTPNLGLCQWEATDPFLREDMNGDFAKIDEAIGRLNDAIESLSHRELFSVTIEEPTVAVFLDLSEYDTDEFAELLLFFAFKDGSKYMRANGVSDAKYVHIYSSGSSNAEKIPISSSSSSRINLYPTHFFYYTPTSGIYGYRMPRADFPKLQSLEIYGSSTKSNFSVGDRITVWGVRR